MKRRQPAVSPLAQQSQSTEGLSEAVFKVNLFPRIVQLPYIKRT